MTSPVPGIVRRLAAEYRPDAWRGICVRVLAGTADVPAHYLAAAWLPGARAPSRWPEAVIIGSPTSERTLAELLRHLPEDASLWLGDVDQLDAALAAEILLAGDRNLEPYQRRAVSAFVAAERDRTGRIVSGSYTDTDPGFVRFLARVVPDGTQR